MVTHLLAKINRLYFRNGGHRRPYYVFSLLFVLLIVNQQGLPIHKPAFQTGSWSVPQKMPVYDLSIDPPILVADQNRTVHAFSSQWIKSPGSDAVRAIVYNKWTLENGWTSPVDILLSPVKEARLTDVSLDKNGIFHLTFFGGDNTYADIYYAQAPATLVDDSRSWSKPFVIAKNAGDPPVASFIEDEQGTFYVVYNGRQFGNSLYVVSSQDGGQNWSNPSPVFFAQRDEPNIAQLTLIRDKAGRFHVLWGVFNIAGQGRGIYYANSENGVNWSEPVLLADASGGLGTQKPSLFEYKDTLFALYLTGVEDSIKVVMRRSNDGGKTWDGPFIIFPRHIGMNGEMSAVVDGNGDLHLFFGERIPGAPDIHGMWHSKYVNNRWLEPEAVVKGPRIVDTEGESGFDPNFARAVVSQGDRILLTWKTDPAAGPNGIWYSYININAPELPLATLPLPKLQATLAVSSDASLKATPVSVSATHPPGENLAPQLFADHNPEAVASSAIFVFTGFVLTILIIAIVAVSYKSRHK